MLLMLFAQLPVLLPLCSWSMPLTKNKSETVVFLVKLSWRYCYGSASESLWRGLTVRCLPHQIRFLFPHWSSLRPSCLAKYSWLNVRHEPSCQEKAGGGAAGLGQPQFGISLLFVIHTEKNESRCRSTGRRGRRREREMLKGNRYCRNKSKATFMKQESKSNLFLIITTFLTRHNSLIGLAQPQEVDPRNHKIFFPNMLSYIKAPLIL